MERLMSVLHLDDDIFMLEKVSESLSQKDSNPIQFRVESVQNEKRFKDALKKGRWDVILVDIHLGAESTVDGVSMMSYAREVSPESLIMMCSSQNDTATVVDCLSKGANDFISKTSDSHEMKLRVVTTIRHFEALKGSKRSNNNPGRTHNFSGAFVKSLEARIPLLIDSAVSSVHVFGESGTGKEVVASLFEDALGHSTPFVKINCGAIAPTLLESELFGHVKGAFTGANSDKRGLIEAADRGWIFLDEIATLSEQAQVSLLRVLENGVVRRVGGTTEKEVQIRVISATNESLSQLVKEKKFRLDLWQRLCEAQIELKPLRDRPEDIDPLIDFFLKNMRGGPYTIEPSARSVLNGAEWKEGNIRELRNCLRAMTELSIDKKLTAISIPKRVWEQSDDDGQEVTSIQEQSPSIPSQTLKLQWDSQEMPSFDTMCELLLLEIVKASFAKKGKMSLRSLSKEIGVSRSTLSSKIRSLCIVGHIELEELNKMVGVGEIKAS